MRADLIEELIGQLDAFANNRHHSFITTQQMAREARDMIRALTSPVVPVAAKAEAEGWPEIAEHFRQGMLDAEAILNSVPLEATKGPAIVIDLKAVAMSRAADRLRKARHDMIHKYGPGYLNAAPICEGEGT